MTKGFAVRLNDEILIRTVSDTQLAAQVNGLALVFNCWLQAGAAREYIDHLPNDRIVGMIVISQRSRKWAPPRAYVVLYRTGTECPRCWGRSWHVGRLLAECANERCRTALPLAPTSDARP